MKIVVFSDSHASGHPSSWKAFFDKRGIGLFNHTFIRKHQHNQELLAVMVKKILEISPDIVFCTGDLTTDGEPSEFALCRQILQPLVESKKFEFYYVPGNHDNYVCDRICHEALIDAFHYLNRGKIDFGNLPCSFTFKGIDFCLANESYPVFLVLSTGIMKKKTSEYILKWCSKDNKHPKVLVGHFPLIENHPILRMRHKLWGGKQVLKALLDKKIDLSICGHVHSPQATLDNRGRGEIITGSITRKACIAHIEYDEKGDTFIYKQIQI